MLRDILNPFQQVVARGRRAPHAGAGGSAEGTPTGNVVIPVRRPPNAVEGAGPHAVGRDDHLAARLRNGPGPGEVAPPRWWQTHGTGTRPSR
jgi:hypothetical protein